MANDPTAPEKAPPPLEQVKEQQRIQQEDHQVRDNADATAQVPGQGTPSDIRHHPQRKN